MSGDLLKIFTISFLITAVTFSIKAQNQFEKQIFVGKNDTLLYNILRPLKYNASLKDGQEKIFGNKRYPLVLFLHGAGERGSDNEQQIIHIKELFLNLKNQNKFQAFVIAPQCPSGKRWVEVNWSAKSHTIPNEASWAIKNTIVLFEEIIEKFPIDTNRIYITGVSMGGYGTWDMISRYPEKFAAAIPICGGGDESIADRLKNMPIWAFHGDNDKVVPVERSRNMIKAIKRAGGNPKYAEYKGVGHGSWIRAYKEKALLEWLFEQKLE